MTEEKVKDKGGRPSKYKEEYNKQAEKLCKLGAKDTDLANFFEVEEKTINNWKIEHENFLQSIKAGKDYYDTEAIELSLAKKAVGYMVTEEKEEVSENGIKKITSTRHVPASDTAMIYWLNNRSRGRFKQKQEIEHSGEVTTFNMNYGDKPEDADD